MAAAATDCPRLGTALVGALDQHGSTEVVYGSDTLAEPRITIRLPVLPPGRAKPFTSAPFDPAQPLTMNGHIDLTCGQCGAVLARGVFPGSISTLVMVCLACNASNVCFSVPNLLRVIEHVRENPAAIAHVPVLQAMVQAAQDQGTEPEELLKAVELQIPDLAWLRELVVPTNPAEFWAVVAAIIAFLAWYGSRKPARTESPATIVNNYYGNHTMVTNNYYAVPPAPSPQSKKVGRNDPCTCGSGKKFKKCCGAPDQ